MTDLVRINSGLSSSATPLTAAPFTLDAGTLPIVPSTEVRPTFHVLYKRLHFSKNKTQYVCVYTHIYVIQRASEASEADSQSCSIEISDIYIYI